MVSVSTRIHEFCDIAEDCLSAAGLPGFYPPHLMEQAVLLSIALAYSTNGRELLAIAFANSPDRGKGPEAVYGAIREAIQGQARAKSKAKRKN